MRHVVQGALGAGLLYPLIWYGLAPVPVDVVADAAVAARGPAERGTAVPEDVLSVGAPSGLGTLRAEPGMPRAEVSRRETLAVSPASASAGEVPLPREPTLPSVARPQVPAPSEPTAASPLPPGLPELLSRVSDVQHSAVDPTELAKRVQTLEANPAELAQLKAFADQFVRLPPSAAERYVSGSEASATSAAERAASR